MNGSFFDGHNELYHDAKFGEDRTMHAGCRCENVVFVFFHKPAGKSYLPSPKSYQCYFTFVFEIFYSSVFGIEIVVPTISMPCAAVYSARRALSSAEIV